MNHHYVEDRDKTLEDLWDKFGDIPMNPETERIERDFCYDNGNVIFPAGTHREDIWHWFDERYSQGVYYLMYKTDMKKTM